jgi:hypothetical protein
VITMKAAGVRTVAATSTPDLVDVQIRVLELERRVRALEAAEAARRRSRLRPGDVPALAKILPAVIGALGSEPFVSSDLVELARDNVGLAAVLGRSSKQLGRLFARAEGLELGGYLVERGARCWRVLAVCGD